MLDPGKTYSKDEIKKLVEAALVSSETYKTNVKFIRSKINQADATFLKIAIEKGLYYIKNKENGEKKQYALTMIRHLMETKNDSVKDAVAKDIVGKLQEIVCKTDKKAKDYFDSSSAKVKKITDSFYTLAIECIVHWDKWFGVDAKGKTTKYRKALEKCIESGIPIPTKFEFFKEKKKKDKSQPEERKFDSNPSQISDMDRSQSKKSANDLQKFKTADPPKKSGGSLGSGFLQALLQDIETNKEFLLNNVLDSQNPEMEVIEMAIEGLKAAQKKINDSSDEIFGSNDETLTPKILSANDAIVIILKEYDKLKKDKSYMPIFQKQVINKLTDSQTPGGPTTGSSKSASQNDVDAQKAKKSSSQDDFGGFGGGDAKPKKKKGGNDDGFGGFDGFDQFKSTPAQVNKNKSDDEFFGGDKKQAPKPSKSQDAFDDFFGGSGSGAGSKKDGADAFKTASGHLDNQNKGSSNQEVRSMEDMFKTAPAEKKKADPFDMWGDADTKPTKQKSEKKSTPPISAKNNDAGGFNFDDFGAYSEKDSKLDQEVSQIEELNLEYDKKGAADASSEGSNTNMNVEGIKVVKTPGAFEGFNFGGAKPSMKKGEPATTSIADSRKKSIESTDSAPKFGKKQSRLEEPPQDNNFGGGFEDQQIKPPPVENTYFEEQKGSHKNSHSNLDDGGAGFNTNPRDNSASNKSGVNFDDFGTTSNKNSGRGGNQSGFEDVNANNNQPSPLDPFGTDNKIKKQSDDFFKTAPPTSGFNDAQNNNNNDAGNQNVLDGFNDFSQDVKPTKTKSNKSDFEDFGSNELQAPPAQKRNSNKNTFNSGFENNDGFNQAPPQQERPKALKSPQQMATSQRTDNFNQNNFNDFNQGQQQRDTDFGNQQLGGGNNQDSFNPQKQQQNQFGNFNPPPSNNFPQTSPTTAFMTQDNSMVQTNRNNNQFNNNFDFDRPSVDNRGIDPNSSAIVARSIISAKYEELESDRLRKERDNILSELESVKRNYNALKVEYDYVKRDFDTLSNDHTQTKDELSRIKKNNNDNNMINEQLKMENDSFQKLKVQLVSENEKHIKNMEELHREIAVLKERLSDNDVKDKKHRTEAKVQEMETTLRNTQEQFTMLQELHKKVTREFQQVNKELEAVKNASLKDATEQLTQNLESALQEKLALNNFDINALRSPINDAILQVKRNYYEGERPTNSNNVSQYQPSELNLSPRKPILPSTVQPNPAGVISLPNEDPQISHANDLIMRARKLREDPLKPIDYNATTTTPYPGPTPTNQFDYIAAPTTSYIGYNDKKMLSPIPGELERRAYYSPPKTFDKRELTPLREESYDYRPSYQGPLEHKASVPNLNDVSYNQYPSALPSYRTPTNVYDTGLNRANDILSKAREAREQPLSSLPPTTQYTSTFAPVDIHAAPKDHNLPLSLDRQNTASFNTSTGIRVGRSPPRERNLSSVSPDKFNAIKKNDVKNLPAGESIHITEKQVPLIDPAQQYDRKQRSPVRQHDVKAGDTRFEVPKSSTSSNQFDAVRAQMADQMLYSSNETNKGNFGKENNVGYSVATEETPSKNLRKINFNKAHQQGTPSQEINVRTVSNVPPVKFSEGKGNLEMIRMDTIDSSHKEKLGTFQDFDYKTFDLITNSIYANPFGRDIDNFKYTCLVNKAALFDSNILQIGCISRLENGNSQDAYVKVTLHFGNKTSETLSNFTVDAMSNKIQLKPSIQKATINTKSQLKQEIILPFNQFNFTPHVLQISFNTEKSTTPTRLSVPLPLTLNKYMMWKRYEKGGYKYNWKSLKADMLKFSYRNINAKFIKSPSELNRFFDGQLIDVTPTINPKNKTKLGGAFFLPDGHEYFVRFHFDTSRIKIMVSTNTHDKHRAEWAIQYLAYLLSV